MQFIFILICFFHTVGALQTSLDQIIEKGQLSITHEWEHHLLHTALFHLCQQEPPDDLLKKLEAADGLPILLRGVETSLTLNFETEIAFLQGTLTPPTLEIQSLEPSYHQKYFEGIWEVLQQCFYIGSYPLLEMLDHSVLPLTALDGQTVCGILWLTEHACEIATEEETLQATVYCFELGGRLAHYPHANIGRAFFNEVIRRGYRFGLLWVEEENWPAIQIYKHYGWQEVQRTAGMIEMRIDWQTKESFKILSEPPTPLWQQLKS